MLSPRIEEMHLSPKSFALFALLAAFSAPALAADLPTLPSTAISQPAEPDWKGFYIGSGVSFSAVKGAKGQVGGDIFDIPVQASRARHLRFAVERCAAIAAVGHHHHRGDPQSLQRSQLRLVTALPFDDFKFVPRGLYRRRQQ